MTSAGGTQPPPKRVIFIDFGGVISIDEFWLSLRQEATRSGSRSMPGWSGSGTRSRASPGPGCAGNSGLAGVPS